MQVVSVDPVMVEGADVVVSVVDHVIPPTRNEEGAGLGLVDGHAEETSQGQEGKPTIRTIRTIRAIRTICAIRAIRAIRKIVIVAVVFSRMLTTTTGCCYCWCCCCRCCCRLFLPFGFTMVYQS